jgi:hypothetical protein
MSLLGKLFARGVADDEDVVLRPSRQFTRQDIVRIAERAAIEFRNRSMNLISCFGPLEGEFGLYSTLSNFVQTKNPAGAEINEAVQAGDEIALLQVLIQALEVAFVELYNKGALARLQLVENIPAEAMSEWIRMLQRVGPTSPAAAPTSQVEDTPVVPVVSETPVETCSREFRELPSREWKRKWLDNRKNRSAADQAAAEGRI